MVNSNYYSQPISKDMRKAVILIILGFLGRQVSGCELLTFDTLKGTVIRSDTWEPIPFACVALLNQGRIEAVKQTDANGEFCFPNASRSVYDLHVTFIGMIGFVKRIDNNKETNKNYIIELKDIFIDDGCNSLNCWVCFFSYEGIRVNDEWLADFDSTMAAQKYIVNQIFATESGSANLRLGRFRSGIFTRDRPVS